MCGWTGHIQDSEAELLPAAETSEAELGPPSKFTSALRRAMEIWATATFSAESVRGRKAECAVQRSILSPGTAKLRRVQRTKQPKHNESEALPAAETAELELGQLSKFTSALRRAMEIWLTAIKGAAVCLLQARCDGRSKSREPQPPGGRNFCPAYAGRNGFPSGAWRFCDTLRDRLWSLSLSVCVAAGQRRDDRIMRRPILPRWRWRRCGRRSCQSRPTPSNRPTAR